MAGNSSEVLSWAGMKGLENLPVCGNNELPLLVGNTTEPGLGKLSSLGLLVLSRVGTEVKPQPHKGLPRIKSFPNPAKMAPATRESRNSHILGF